MRAKNRPPTVARLTEAVKTRWLKWIVGYCIGFSSVIIVACYVAAWFGVDTGDVLNAVRLIFGGELFIAAGIKLIGGKSDGAAGKTTAVGAAKPTVGKSNKPLNG